MSNRNPVFTQAHHPLPETGDRLTPREGEVMGLVAIGKTNQEIASILCIAIKTVEKYMAALYIKADVRNRVELVLWWIRPEVIE